MGQVVRRIWTTNKDAASPKLFIEQTFEEALSEYGVVYAYNNGFKLSYIGSITDRTILDLRQIEVHAGYWLCNYDGHTGEWLFMHYDNRELAKAAYRQLYMRYFRHQEWFWIVKIDHRG